MRKIIVVNFIFYSFLCLFSCKNNIKTEEQLFKNNPVTINWNDISEEIKSIEANVKVFSRNNRTVLPLQQVNQYRLLIKYDNSNIVTRIDSNSDKKSVIKRSVISDGKEMVVFNTEEKDILCRIPLDDENDDFSFLRTNPITGRVNIEKVISESKRLMLDIIDDINEKGLYTIFLPENKQSVNTKIVFDVVNNVLYETEVVSIPEPGVLLITTQAPVYQEINNEIIKIGCITTVETKYEKLVEGFTDDYEVYESEEDIPELTKEELKILQDNGTVSENVSIVLGNPADLSNIETIIELYEYVEINNVNDNEFRLLFGE